MTDMMLSKFSGLSEPSMQCFALFVPPVTCPNANRESAKKKTVAVLRHLAVVFTTSGWVC